MIWEFTYETCRGPHDVYLDGKLINDVMCASAKHGMVKIITRPVRLLDLGIASFEIRHGHVRVDAKPVGGWRISV